MRCSCLKGTIELCTGLCLGIGHIMGLDFVLSGYSWFNIEEACALLLFLLTSFFAIVQGFIPK